MITYPFLLQVALIWTIEQCSCRLFNLFPVFLVDRPEFSKEAERAPIAVGGEHVLG